MLNRQMQRRAKVRRAVRGRPVRAVRVPVRRSGRTAVQPDQVSGARDRFRAEDDRPRPPRAEQTFYFKYENGFFFFFFVKKQK